MFAQHIASASGLVGQVLEGPTARRFTQRDPRALPVFNPAVEQLDAQVHRVRIISRPAPGKV